MEINWRLLTFFMQYIHLMDGANHNFMSNQTKDKTVTVSMNTVNIPSIEVKVWTYKGELP